MGARRGGSARRASSRGVTGFTSDTECPCWWLHWSAPEKGGRSPAFCSVCGSRSQSRRRLQGASVTLRQQIELLREIARRQSDDLHATAGAHVAFNEATTLGAGLDADQSSKDRAASCRATIERLQRELCVWRGDDACRAAVTSQQSAVAMLRRDEVAHEELRVQSSIGLSELRAATEQIRREIQARELECAAMRISVVEPSNTSMQATLTAEQRLVTVRHEIAEARRAEVERAARDKRVLLSIRNDLALVDRRLEVETELMRAQEMQLRSVDAASEALRLQANRVNLEASELKASLEQSQETLRRLQH